MVTGGCGFIGSNFVRYVINNYPAEVVNLDALTYAGAPENLRDVEKNPRYKFIKGNVCDPHAVAEAMEGADAVVHFAAESHVDRSIEDPAVFVMTNVVGTQVLLDRAMKLKLEFFVQISTDEVYGSLGPEGYFTEATPLCPNSPYSASKAGADMLALAYQHTFGLPVAVTRCSNNYGPYQFPGKTDPSLYKQRPEGQAGPAIRRRPERAGLAPRLRPLQSGGHGDAKGRARRGIQHRR